MSVRDAVPADAEAIRTVHAESIRKLGRDAYSQEQIEAWVRGCESADYTETIEAEGTETVVAEDDGTVVGFGTVTFTAPEGYDADVDADVTAVYVHPSADREGVGTRIYRELEERARRRGVQTLGLWASLNAVPFYETHGYERVTEHSHEFSSHESTGVTGTVVEMKKRLE